MPCPVSTVELALLAGVGVSRHDSRRARSTIHLQWGGTGAEQPHTHPLAQGLVQYLVIFGHMNVCLGTTSRLNGTSVAMRLCVPVRCSPPRRRRRLLLLKALGLRSELPELTQPPCRTHAATERCTFSCSWHPRVSLFVWLPSPSA